MAKKRGRQRGVLRAVRSPAAELAGLRGGFVAWLLTNGLPTTVDPAELADDAAAAVDLATARAGLTDLGTWTPDLIRALTEDADDTDLDALAAVPPLLAFLADTGHWHGTEADFDAAVAAAEEATSPVPAVLAALATVTVDPEVEDAAIRTLPLIGQVEALLRFLLPRRAVTATGALRRADTATAAGLVGVDLEGRTPRTMWDVPRLAILWEVLTEAGLLEVDDRAALPTPLAHAWISGDAEQGRRARTLVVGGYLAEVALAPPELPWLPDPLDTLLPLLAAAAIGAPAPAPRVPELTSDPEVAASVLAVLPAQGRLEQLAQEGILDVSDTVGAAPGLEAVLARACTAILREDDDLPLPTGASASGETWRLRVELEGAQPPIWREVLVDSGLTLAGLHAVIQRLFGWEDYHLHEFSSTGPGRRVSRFAPPAEDDDWPQVGPPPKDERRVRLDRVIGPGRGRLQYRYDFGDSWDHRITVVGSEASGGPLPRCTGGAGTAPQEDSGGVWGWSDKVAAAQDPRHPEHDDVRDWLGLADGETLDPTAFDVAEVDRRLAPLRGRSRP
jgi:hypothetical protein